MSKPWLLIDTNYMARRAMHSTGHLQFGDVKTGLVYGVLQSVRDIGEKFGTSKFIWCFDYGKNKRLEVLPTYKSSRKKKRELNRKERRAEASYQEQLRQLHKKYLSKIGFKNIFAEDGYEADDMIAVLLKTVLKKEEAVIISSDHDLYQLVTKRHVQYNPNSGEVMHRKLFKKRYSLKPSQWARVKALAGCSSDDVPGVKGVGENTAISYINGTLPEHYKVYQRLENEGVDVELENMGLVSLPFGELRGRKAADFVLQEDDLTWKRWSKFCKKYGMASILDHPPIPLERKQNRGRKRQSV